MRSRIQQVLDGELSREQLTSEERERLAEVEGLIDGVLGTFADRPMPDLSAAVLRRIEQTQSSQAVWPRRSFVDWLWSPRPLQWRPAYAFAAVALLVALVSMPFVREPAEPLATASRIMVEFKFDAPQASRVELAGDFTNWQPSYVMKRSGTGIWTIVVPMNPGVHDYAFIVDGKRWLPDPTAPAVSDGFGGLNSRLAVLAPDLTKS